MKKINLYVPVHVTASPEASAGSLVNGVPTLVGQIEVDEHVSAEQIGELVGQAMGQALARGGLLSFTPVGGPMLASEPEPAVGSETSEEVVSGKKSRRGKDSSTEDHGHSDGTP